MGELKALEHYGTVAVALGGLRGLIIVSGCSRHLTESMRVLAVDWRRKEDLPRLRTVICIPQLLTTH